MFNYNEFKKSVKIWIQDNPNGQVDDLIDFCEEQIPPSKYTANKWLLDQTVSWYKHILSQRKVDQACYDDEQEAQCAPYPT